MRVLVINGNTSVEVTERIAAEARAVAAKDTEILPVTAGFGAAVIGCRSDDAIAQHAVLDVAARHAAGADAILIAVSLDTALGALREAATVPVVGMTEAALLSACMLGERFGLVAFGRRLAVLYENLVIGYGLRSRMAAMHVLETDPVQYSAVPGGMDEAVRDAALHLVDEERADVVVVLGAVAAGMPRRLRDSVPVPLLDGVSCGIVQCEALARLGPAKPSRGSAAPPSGGPLTGVGESLQRFLRGRG